MSKKKKSRSADAGQAWPGTDVSIPLYARPMRGQLLRVIERDGERIALVAPSVVEIRESDLCRAQGAAVQHLPEGQLTLGVTDG